MSQNLKTNAGFDHNDASPAVSQNLKSNESFDHNDAFPAVSVHVETKGFKPKLRQYMHRISLINHRGMKYARNLK